MWVFQLVDLTLQVVGRSRRGVTATAVVRLDGVQGLVRFQELLGHVGFVGIASDISVFDPVILLALGQIAAGKRGL